MGAVLFGLLGWAARAAWARRQGQGQEQRERETHTHTQTDRQREREIERDSDCDYDCDYDCDRTRTSTTRIWRRRTGWGRLRFFSRCRGPSGSRGRALCGAASSRFGPGCVSSWAERRRERDRERERESSTHGQRVNRYI